jgi:hypothetical protein
VKTKKDLGIRDKPALFTALAQIRQALIGHLTCPEMLGLKYPGFSNWSSHLNGEPEIKHNYYMKVTEKNQQHWED